jgi:hypothetical protein
LSGSNGAKRGWGSRKERLVLAIPGLGLLTIALVWSLGGGERPVLSAQVYGGPSEADGPFHGRLLVLETEGGTTEPVPWREIEVVRQGPTREVRVVERTRADGWVDVQLPAVGGHSLDLNVSDRISGQRLAAGRPVFERSRWQRASRRGLDKKLGQALGVRVPSGVLVTPFWGEVSIRSCQGLDTPLWLHAEGGDLGRAPFETRARDGTSWFRLAGRAAQDFSFGVRPLDHIVELEFHCEGAKPDQVHRLHLPVVPGAFFVELGPREATIRSARGHKTAFFTWVTESERLEGGRVELTPQPDSSSEGRLPLPDDRAGRYLVLASSPDGRSPSTVGYPIDGQDKTFDAVDGHLLDGTPAALAGEVRRSRRIRRMLWGYVAALFSLAWVLFRLVVQASDQQLRKSLETAEQDGPFLKPLPRLPLELGGFLIALGLSLVLVWLAL